MKGFSTKKSDYWRWRGKGHCCHLAAGGARRYLSGQPSGEMMQEQQQEAADILEKTKGERDNG